jgi:hypothetical protein
MKSMYTSVIKYTRLVVEGKPDRLVPSRVSWFHMPVKFMPGDTLHRHERPLTMGFLFSGHAEYIANLINSEQKSGSKVTSYAQKAA